MRQRGIGALWIALAIMTFGPPAIGAAPADTGRLEGGAGGNERGVTVFRPGHGQVGFYFTGPSGRYHFDDLAPGRYMVSLNGHIAPYIAIRAGKTTRLDWAKQPHFDPPCETWSPARTVLGQTFRATGSWMGLITFWIPGDPIRLVATIHEDGPGGRRIGPAKPTDDKVAWVTEFGWKRGEVPLVEGRRYYLRLACPDGDRWNVGTPGLGDVYPDGMTFYDDVAQPDSDLSINIRCLDDSLLNMAGGGKNLGFIEKGPGSGTCRRAGQFFVATADNCIRAGIRAGWGGNPRETDFIYTIREDGPGGEPVGPPLRVGMVSDWGSDALWAPGAVRLTPGRRYFLDARRADGEPFYAYLTRDVYSSGTAWRDGEALADFELDFSVLGESVAGSVTYLYNVIARVEGDDSAVIEWETGTPADARVRYGRTVECERATAPSAQLARRHRIAVSGLEPGATYYYRAVSSTQKPNAVPIHSRIYELKTPAPPGVEPQRDEKAIIESAPTPGEPLALANPGFEDGFAGWQRMGDHGDIARTAGDTPFAPRNGQAMWGWSYDAKDDAGWREPYQIDNHAIIHQTVAVEPGATYELSAWLRTADQGSGWERDSRIQLIVDLDGKGDFGAFGRIDDRCASQAYATHDRWRRCRLRFKAEGDRVSVGLHFWQWWALETSHLYADEVQLIRVAE